MCFRGISACLTESHADAETQCSFSIWRASCSAFLPACFIAGPSKLCRGFRDGRLLQRVRQKEKNGIRELVFDREAVFEREIVRSQEFGPC